MTKLSQIMAKPALAPAKPQNGLVARVKPLNKKEIGKINDLLAEYSEEKNIFGDIPVKDSNGETYKWEWGVTGKKTEYDAANIPDRLKEALLRPCTKDVIISHLSELSLMLKSSLGREGLAMVVYKVAEECSGVPEWGIIQACKEISLTNDWFPSFAKIVKTIKEKENDIEQQLNPSCAENKKAKRIRWCLRMSQFVSNSDLKWLEEYDSKQNADS